jgi:hypothetical protein
MQYQLHRFATLFIIFLTFAVSGYSQQTCDQITRAQLREKLAQLGYEVKDIVKDAGKEKFSVTLNKEGLDIPVAAEISGNTKYIWLTVNLGNPPSQLEAMNNTLLKKNAEIQPSFFYITEAGRLMMGLPLNNLGITNAFLRDRIESIAGNVALTRTLWQR